jgi:hypothetical protein
LKDVYANLALSESLSGNLEASVSVYQDAISRFPTDESLHVSYCKLIASTMRDTSISLNIASRLGVCEKSAEVASNDPYPLMILAQLLAVDLNAFKPAVGVMDKWLSKFQGRQKEVDLGIKELLASSLVRISNHERAFKVAMEVMEADPTAEHIESAAYMRKVGWPADKVAVDLSERALKKFMEQLDIKDPRICKSGTWRLALNYTEESLLHPESLTVTLLNAQTAYTSYGSADQTVFVGPEMPFYPNVFHERYINLVYIKDAFISGNPGIIHSNCVVYSGVLLFSRISMILIFVCNLGSHHIALQLMTFPKRDKDIEIVDVNERVVSIVQLQMAENYYHWMHEALPKLLYLQNHVLNLPGNEDIRILSVNPNSSKHMLETFNLPELSSLKSRIILYENYRNRRYHLKKGVFIVDWIHAADDTHHTISENIWARFWPPREILLHIRHVFHDVLRNHGRLPTLDAHVKHAGSIVYISRRSATRAVPNEQELIDELKTRFGSLVVIHRGSEPLLDQIELFAKARVVVGMHGAGLTNFAFTLPGARMVMVPMDPHVEFCFGHLVAALDERHWVVTGVPGSHFFGNYPEMTRESIEMLGDAIDDAMRDVYSISHNNHNEL